MSYEPVPIEVDAAMDVRQCFRAAIRTAFKSPPNGVEATI